LEEELLKYKGGAGMQGKEGSSLHKRGFAKERKNKKLGREKIMMRNGGKENNSGRASSGKSLTNNNNSRKRIT